MNNLTLRQQAIYEIIQKHGPLPDHVLVPIAQHESPIHQSSSGIRTRRSELVNARKVKAVSTVTMPSGREAVVWDAV